MSNNIEFTRINNDVNGNPRYVCHFTEIVNEADRERAKETSDYLGNLYRIAIKKANAIGGRKFHCKQYGGGLVFQSYNIGETEKYILEQKQK